MSTTRVLRRIEHALRSTAAAPLCIDLLGFWLRAFVFGNLWKLRLLGSWLSCSLVAGGGQGDRWALILGFLYLEIDGYLGCFVVVLDVCWLLAVVRQITGYLE